MAQVEKPRLSEGGRLIGGRNELIAVTYEARDFGGNGVVQLQEWITGFFKGAVKTEVALPIFIASVAILFLPDDLLREVGLNLLAGEYRYLHGAALLYSGSALASRALIKLGLTVRGAYDEFWAGRQRRALLNGLTPDERAMLRPYIFEQRSEIHERFGNGTINLLRAKNIVFRASNLAVHYDTFAWGLQPWARTALEREPSLLQD